MGVHLGAVAVVGLVVGLAATVWTVAEPAAGQRVGFGWPTGPSAQSATSDRSRGPPAVGGTAGLTDLNAAFGVLLAMAIVTLCSRHASMRSAATAMQTQPGSTGPQDDHGSR